MQFVVPMVVDDTNLTTDVVNADADWMAGTIALGERRVEGESVYEVVADPDTTDQPTVGVDEDPPTWIRLGYSNEYRMWRDGVDSISTATGDISVSLPVPTAISTVGVLNAVGLEVNVQLIDTAFGGIAEPIIEDIAGTKDGANTAFTITDAGQEVYVYLNGQKLTEGTGYTRVTTAITATGKIPFANDSYIAIIHTADEPAIEDISGTKDGANTAFTITEAAGEAILFLNGQKLTEGVAYTRSGVDITATGQIPESGDFYEAIIFTVELPIVGNISGTKDGVNTAFTVSTLGTASLFLNGMRLVEGVDYDKNGINVTATGSIPEASDLYEATIYSGGVVYDRTIAITDIGVGDWWSYFFLEYSRNTSLIFDDIPAYFGSGVTIHITIISTGPSDPSSVGRVVVGSALFAGQSLMGVTSRNLTFSRKDRDEFGNLILVPRRTIRVVDFPVMIPSGDTYNIQQAAAALAATPTLFIADPDLPETVVFGVFENFDVIVNGLSITECSIGVEEF